MASILLVDDDESTRNAIARFLRTTNHTVDDVDRVRIAYDLLERHPYDLIISDNHMPEKQGIDFVTELRKSGNEIPFILLSGDTDLDDRCREQRALYAPKPIDGSVLLALIEQALG